MKIIKEELQFEENLKKRLEVICEFSKVTPIFIKRKMVKPIITITAMIVKFNSKKM